MVRRLVIMVTMLLVSAAVLCASCRPSGEMYPEIQSGETPVNTSVEASGEPIGETPGETPGQVSSEDLQASPTPDIEETVLEFYRQYTAYPGNPLVSGAYRDHPALNAYLSESWVEQVDEMLASFQDQGGGFDPFVCAQDRPS